MADELEIVQQIQFSAEKEGSLELSEHYPHVLKFVGGEANAEISAIYSRIKKQDTRLSSMQTYHFAAAEWLSDYFEEVLLLKEFLVYLDEKVAYHAAGDLADALRRKGNILSTFKNEEVPVILDILDFRTWVKNQLPDTAQWWRGWIAAQENKDA